MPIIEAIERDTENPEVKAVFDDIEQAFGMVPNLFKTAAHFPPLMEANWNKVKAVMMGGTLSRKSKEAIAVLVSSDNSCDYCVGAHTAILSMIGSSEEEISHIMAGDFSKAGIDEKEAALIALAREANKNPNDIAKDTFETLRAKGATSAEIVETLGVMETYTAFNKFLDTLQVAIDF